MGIWKGTIECNNTIHHQTNAIYNGQDERGITVYLKEVGQGYTAIDVSKHIAFIIKEFRLKVYAVAHGE